MGGSTALEVRSLIFSSGKRFPALVDRIGYNTNVSEAWREGHQIDDVIQGVRAYFGKVHGYMP